MTPAAIAEETELPRATVRQLLRRMKIDGEVLSSNRKALYAHPDKPGCLASKSHRG